MKYKTIKSVRLELHARGGYLSKIQDTELPEYVPQLNWDEPTGIHGTWIKDELLDWANQHLT
jgi:hypothetical protein